ncbi:Coagulation factor XII [Merluccius polli]|uniref:trypsin n=1 Tax=Merluccius polli TaxID=89951 RepID=A0AA47NRD1_MERPO|nr:Coagulation factor XII [Merluccius polli]
MKLGILLFLLFLVVLILPAQDNDGNEDDGDDDENDPTEWLYDLQEPESQCNPNPCFNGGVCEEKRRNRFKCECPKPFKGKKCERGPRVCKKSTCKRGECVLTSTYPFFECKCKAPFQPPNCQEASLCSPNTCKNGGKCITDGEDFDCVCAKEYSGRFCHVGPEDCFEGEGDSYRGNVTETEDGDECLHWNSNFILDKGINPFTTYENSDGLGPHNFCRNPDGDTMPWCFIRKGRKLRWEYCDVEQCLKPTGRFTGPTSSRTRTTTTLLTSSKYVPLVIPPGPLPPVPEPTDPKPTEPKPTEPKPTEPKPTEPKPTEPKPTEPKPTEPKPTKPEPTQPEPTQPEPTQSPEPAPTPSDEPTQFSTCGKAEPKKLIQRIWGGLKAIPGSLPWQVSLQVRPKGGKQVHRHICGGVLIESCWVLTAGHCIDQKHEMQAVVGGLVLGLEEPTVQTLEVEEAIVHENYRESPNVVSNDIALLRLKSNKGTCAKETQFVRKICLPESPMHDGSECTISGWGATENALYSDHLLDAKVLLINHETCSSNEVYGSVLGSGMFCAGHLQGGVDSCQGDSGGPLICKQNQAEFIYGLVSWGDQCGRKNKPGVYTQVSYFLDWIKSTTRAALERSAQVTLKQSQRVGIVEGQLTLLEVGQHAQLSESLSLNRQLFFMGIVAGQVLPVSMVDAP